MARMRIETYIDSLWATALRLTENRHDAEDLVQEACLKAYENLDSLRHDMKKKMFILVF